jgi:amino acid adenylation domain-containing protein/FkbM family methyltransferase
MNNIIQKWNNTSVNYAYQCLHQAIEQQVQRSPDATALIFAQQQLSYAELNQLANQLAHYLQHSGVEIEEVVAIQAQRSIEMVVALLAILKVGAAYLPLDPDYPPERLEFMLQDAKVKHILTQVNLSQLKYNANYIILDLEKYQNYAKNNLELELSLDNLAYVIYTSGSTGKPKGAMNTHLAISNRLLWMQAEYKLNNNDKVLQKTPFSFDVSVWEFFWPLMVGAQLVLAKPKGHQEPQYLMDLIASQAITTIHFVPSMLRTFLQLATIPKEHKLQRVFCSGEALTVELQQQFFVNLPKVQLHNLYGPTEAAVDVSFWACSQEENLSGTVPIGYPIANIQLYILDAQQQLLPIGEIGELYIAGLGLARGYLNRPELTAEKFVFIQLPFAQNPIRAYKTGDLARYRPDGAIEFLGRIDFQVKIRGFRIELGEIETILNQHPLVAQTVVTAVEQEQDTKIAAYIAPKLDTPIQRWVKLREQNKWGNQRSYELANGMFIAHQNKNETDFIYQEIFLHNNYLQHGICIPTAAIIFDVGANIGLFSLFAAQYPQTKIYAFEPIPAIFKNLTTNLYLYNVNAEVYNCGLADSNRMSKFSYYPHASLVSGQFADNNAEQQVLGAYLQQYQYLSSAEQQSLVDISLHAETVNCQLRTLSDIIAEQQLQRIDLLKIDVEKSELLVLQGINGQDWAKILQIVVEVHDMDGRLDNIKYILQQQGFSLVVEQEHNLKQTNLYTVYAKRMDLIPVLPVTTKLCTPTRLIHELRQSLAQQLPEYMLPHYYQWLATIPLNPNGKVDRSALPVIDLNQRHLLVSYVAPQNEKQHLLAKLWAELLQIDKIGIYDNFFELGGHSLLAVQMLAKIQTQWTVELSLYQLFSAPTIAELANLIGKQNYITPPTNPNGKLLTLAYPQQQQWVICQLLPELPIYNEPLNIYFKQAIDMAVLERSLNYLIARHDMLRTNFRLHNEEQVEQVVADISEIKLELYEVSSEDEAKAIATAQAQKLFNLTQDRLIRACVVKLHNSDYRLYLCIHHIILDGVSFYHIFLPELVQVYQAFISQKQPQLPKLRAQYRDFVFWQLQSTNFTAELAYWRQQLENLPVLQLPSDFNPPAQRSFKGKNHLFRLDKDLVAKLTKFAQQEGVSLFMLLLSGFSILLYRYTGQTDMPIATVSGMRQRAEFKSIFGLFLNTLLLRLDLSDKPDYISFLQRVKDTTLAAYKRQNLPFIQLVEQLNPKQRSGYNPLFQVMFDFDPEPPALSTNWQANHFDIHTDTAKFDLTLEFYPQHGELHGRFEYSTDLFSAARICRLTEHLIVLLQELIKSPQQLISHVNLLTATEQRQFYDWNQTITDYPQQSIASLFAQQVQLSPQAVAIYFNDKNDKTMTYAELNSSANQLAHYLIQQGVSLETPVAICLERGVELIIGLLAILKAGGCYVPFDAQYPKLRQEFMWQDTAVEYLLTQNKFISQLPKIKYTICVDDYESLLLQNTENPPVIAKIDNLAYIMYTSGSTGQPKGVRITQRGVVRLVKNTNYMQFDAKQVFIHFAPIAFDASTWEIWGSLLNGAALVVPAPELNDLTQLGQLIKQYQITSLWLTAGLFQQMVELNQADLSRLRYLLAGGDVLAINQVKQMLQYPDITLINGYGPTENTTFTCCYHINAVQHDNIPIGKPISNTQVYVLDENLQPLPIGITGELYIAGDGLARDYLNRDILTQEKFILINLPWLNTAQRAYKSGDLVRYAADGTLEFIGRSDRQVKIRGFRIELDEIEAYLQQHPAIQQALVELWLAEEKYLIAYYVADTELSNQNLLNYLSQLLPKYMLPQFFIAMPFFPLTANGKIDRQALPLPQVQVAKIENKPLTDLEQSLLQIWQKILPVQNFGIEDNFFQLGGHSLLAIKLVALINQEFRCQFSLRTIFDYPTISLLAQQLSATDRETGEL